MSWLSPIDASISHFGFRPCDEADAATAETACAQFNAGERHASGTPADAEVAEYRGSGLLATEKVPPPGHLDVTLVRGLVSAPSLATWLSEIAAKH
jgi:hypothetical protein